MCVPSLDVNIQNIFTVILANYLINFRSEKKRKIMHVVIVKFCG